jgi:hypothetical protein
MDVPYLLNLMATLSIGGDNVTDAESDIFLQYLNLAHMELYRETAFINHFIIKTGLYTTKPTPDYPDSSHYARIDFEDEVLDIKYLINQKTNVKLKRTESTELILKSLEFHEKGEPTEYRWSGISAYVWPHPYEPTKFGCIYIPQAHQIKKDTPLVALPYPVSFIDILVDGALYYLFQEEGSFKNAQKAAVSRERWERGKEAFSRYLLYTSGDIPSTFNNL